MQLDLFDQPPAPDAASRKTSCPADSSMPHQASGAVLTKSDRARLQTLQAKVEAFMSSGEWRTLAAIHAACGGTEASCSARLRQARAAGFTVERRQVSAGLFEYRMLQPAVLAFCPCCKEMKPEDGFCMNFHGTQRICEQCSDDDAMIAEDEGLTD